MSPLEVSAGIRASHVPHEIVEAVAWLGQANAIWPRNQCTGLLKCAQPLRRLRWRHTGAQFVHDDSSAGCKFTVRDLTGDGKPDMFTINKRGTFLLPQD